MWEHEGYWYETKGKSRHSSPLCRSSTMLFLQHASCRLCRVSGDEWVSRAARLKAGIWGFSCNFLVVLKWALFSRVLFPILWQLTAHIMCIFRKCLKARQCWTIYHSNHAVASCIQRVRFESQCPVQTHGSRQAQSRIWTYYPLGSTEVSAELAVQRPDTQRPDDGAGMAHRGCLNLVYAGCMDILCRFTVSRTYLSLYTDRQESWWGGLIAIQDGRNTTDLDKCAFNSPNMPYSSRAVTDPSGRYMSTWSWWQKTLYLCTWRQHCICPSLLCASCSPASCASCSPASCASALSICKLALCIYLLMLMFVHLYLTPYMCFNAHWILDSVGR